MSNEKMKLMFTEITWAMYLQAVAILLFVYYSLLILKFYAPQIRASLSSVLPGAGILHRLDTMEAPDGSVITKEEEPLTSSGSFTAPESGNDYEMIEEIVARVKSALYRAAEIKLEPAGVLSDLRMILSAYPALAHSTFRPSITEFITTESGLHGYPAITQVAVEQLWPQS